MTHLPDLQARYERRVQRRSPDALYVKQFKAMACACEIQLESGEHADAHAQAAIAEVLRIEAKYSRYRVDSVLSLVNAAAGRHFTEVDAETHQLLNFAQLAYELSGGLFDISSGVLRRAWKFPSSLAHRTAPQLVSDDCVPSAQDLSPLLELIGLERCEILPGANGSARVKLTRQGMELDFGGFGKEYAVDRAVQVLQARGVSSALVNLGGDVRVLGGVSAIAAPPRPWRIAIQHPRDCQKAVGYVDLSDAALATSGDYERYFEANGVRYSHLLDPRTGYPVRGVQAVSVQAPSCLMAGALATISLLKGAAGLAFLRAQAVNFLWISETGEQIRA